jgi:hypothetical protein
MRTERGILAEMQDNVRQREPVPFVHRVKSDLLILLMRSPARVKVPGPVSAVVLPGNDVELLELTEAWNDSRPNWGCGSANSTEIKPHMPASDIR